MLSADLFIIIFFWLKCICLIHFKSWALDNLKRWINSYRTNKWDWPVFMN